MKTIAINTGASFPAGLSALQDGDQFRESNTDQTAQDTADGLGYLKGQLDGAAWESNNGTYTGQNTFTDTVTVDGADLVLDNGAVLDAGAGQFNGTLTAADMAYLRGGVAVAVQTGGDGATVISPNVTVVRVPAISQNRVYTLPSVVGLTDGHLVIVRRVDTTAAYTLTVQDPTGPTTLGVISASAAGWLAFFKAGANWRLLMWGGTVTSLSTTP